MNYEVINEKNYDIYLYKTDKFKTISISTVFINDYNKDEITKEKFLSEYLINSNNIAKDEVSMSKKYMELYEPSLSINDYFLDKHHKVYTAVFLNEKYTEKGYDKKTIDFYYNIIFNPNVDKGIFNESNFNLIKSKFISWYKLDEEDSRSIAYFNSLANISDDIPLRIDYRGNLEDLMKIKREELNKYYFDKINNSKVSVFVIGNYNDNIIKCIKDNLKNVKRNDYKLNKFFDVTSVKNVKNIVEEKDFNQSIIYLIYKIIGMTDRERTLVLPVLNNILGGDSAKLFNNVREKNSLAYYSYSSFSSSNNILYMYAGISKENYEKASFLMKEQLEEIKNGNIKDEELENAINSLESSVLTCFDSIGSLSNNLKGRVLLDLPSLEYYQNEYKTVTKEEVINLSHKLELDVEYLLKGVK